MAALPSSCQVCRRWSLRSHILIRKFDHERHASPSPWPSSVTSSPLVATVFRISSRWPTSSMTSSLCKMADVIVLTVCRDVIAVRWKEPHLAASGFCSEFDSRGKVLRLSWNHPGVLGWPTWLDWSNLSQAWVYFIIWCKLGKTPRMPTPVFQLRQNVTSDESHQHVLILVPLTQWTLLSWFRGLSQDLNSIPCSRQCFLPKIYSKWCLVQ